MLPGEELPELDELAPAEAAEALLERMLQYARFRGAGRWLAERHDDQQGHLWRAAPLPAGLRRAPLEAAEAVYDPAVLGQALGGLLRSPAPIDVAHIAVPRVSLAERVDVLRRLLRRGAFSFDEAVRGADRATVAVTLFALLELYKRGEAAWEQAEPFGEITVHANPAPADASPSSATAPARRVDASPSSVTVPARPADAPPSAASAPARRADAPPSSATAPARPADALRLAS
jgi:segregation and condensation protein A